jgi:hypothetical protein
MGILDKFKTPKSTELKNGSEYAPKYDAKDGDVPKSILASELSPLHFNPDNPNTEKKGYSLDGDGLAAITKLYNAYDDGVVNALPKPSKLDDANNDPEFVSTYNPTKQYKYNHPEFIPKP